jgi:hypothetical protein
MCHIFLILSYLYIFLSESYLSHKCHLSMADTPTTKQNNTPPMVSQCLHPSAPLLPPCCQPLPSLAAHCLPLAAQC